MICNLLVQSCKDSYIRLTFANFYFDASAFALIAMIAQRYIVIVHSLKYVRVFKTTKRTFTVIATSWGIPATFFVFDLIVSFSSTELSARADLTVQIIYTTTLKSSTNNHTYRGTFAYPINCSQTGSLQTKALLNQVRFNVAENSLITRQSLYLNCKGILAAMNKIITFRSIVVSAIMPLLHNLTRNSCVRFLYGTKILLSTAFILLLI